MVGWVGRDLVVVLRGGKIRWRHDFLLLVSMIVTAFFIFLRIDIAIL